MYGLYKNCYNICLYYSYFDEKENISFCTNNRECPINYNKLIEEKNICISNCFKDVKYKYEFRNKCYSECPPDSTKKENYDENESYFCKPICNENIPFEIIYSQECVEYCKIKELKNKLCILNLQNLNFEDDKTKQIYNNYFKNLENEITSEDFNTTNLDNLNDDIIQLDHVIITLTTVQNQKNVENNINTAKVDLKECETILKDEYQIPYNETLYMKKIDFIEEGMKIPKITFEVYTKYNSSKLIKLNLSYCSETKIDILIPYNLTENIDIYNLSSKYYNDLCYTATSDTGTDITLKDRKEEYINKNKTICQENCIFTEYNYDSKNAKCSCDVVETPSFFDNMKINKLNLAKNFIDIKNIANINILICYKKLFCKKGILNNYGSYSLICVIFLHFIFIIIYYAKNLNKKIKKIIYKITFAIKNLDLINKKEKNIKVGEILQKTKFFKKEKVVNNKKKIIKKSK